eukprot:Amastigsp_a177873_35.p3 type:complete len:172 gc:universal Amastigsp_a177873_35:436-951(+)
MAHDRLAPEQQGQGAAQGPWSGADRVGQLGEARADAQPRGGRSWAPRLGGPRPGEHIGRGHQIRGRAERRGGARAVHCVAVPGAAVRGPDDDRKPRRHSIRGPAGLCATRSSARRRAARAGARPRRAHALHGHERRLRGRHSVRLGRRSRRFVHLRRARKALMRRACSESK